MGDAEHPAGAGRSDAERDPKERRSPPRDGLADRQAVWVRSAALSGILFLMVMYTMYVAASLIMPIALALLLSLVLSPVVRFLARARIPQPLGALGVLLLVAGVMAGGTYALAEPAAEWMEKAPSELRQLEARLAWVKEPIQEVKAAKEQAEEVARVGSGAGAQAAQPAEPSFSLVDSVLSQAPALAYGVAVMLVLLFFLLASGDSLTRKMVEVTPSLEDKKRVVETARDVQTHVSRFLATITVINLCVGVVVALAMYALGVPNPLLWGAMLAVLNYIPYLGVLITMVVVTFVSLLTFDSPVQVLLPAAVIFGVNVVEGQLVTPVLAGRQLSLSPVAVFLSLVVMGWIWGIVGVLIAVPLLATVKLCCERIEPLEPVATFLGQ